MGHAFAKVKRMNWDVAAYRDLINGTGFICNEPGQIDLDGETKKTFNGPQSPRFGIPSTNDEDSIASCRCACKVGGFRGEMFRGEICPICGEEVKERDIDLDITAWVPFGKNKIINPYYYQLLIKAIGKNFPDIVKLKQRVDRDGKVTAVNANEIEEKPSSPFVGMGITKFMEEYNTVLEYFKVKKKNKIEELNWLQKNKNSVFTSFCPIYTPVLRPQSATTDTLYYTGIDKQINPLIKLSIDLMDCEEIEKNMILDKIQYRVNNMWEYNFSLINGKEGFIRDKLLGGQLNYSARNVICPDPTLTNDEISVSYQTFRILARDLIIYNLMRQDHILLSKAYIRWKKSYKFDKYIYEIMKFILKKYEPMILLNRNPTLNFYSMLRLKIRDVKPDDMDYTLSVSLGILPGLNADFDGDILNMFLLSTKEVKYLFRKFSPTERMIIDRATGLLNSNFAIEKSQLIDLYHFATL